MESGAAAARSEPHARQGRLRTLATARESLVAGDGRLLQPAPPEAAGQATRSYVLHDVVRTVPARPHHAG